MSDLYGSRYFQVTMHPRRTRRPSSVFILSVFIAAAVATGVFRLALWGLTQGGWLRPEDTPGRLAFLGFYLFFVAVIWLGEHPFRRRFTSTDA